MFKPLMPLDEAWARLAQALSDSDTSADRTSRLVETVPTEQALARVLAQDLVSGVDVPPHDNSAMDGYAVRQADVQALMAAGATAGLPQAQRIAAGQVGEALAPGHCARIFTGAPVPPGADAVVMQEHTEPGTDGTVRFTQPVRLGQNIR